MKWTMQQVVDATGGRLLYGAPALQVNGVGIDSRTIAPDTLFVAIVGERHDGHSFLPQVVASGCRALVINQDAAKAIDHDPWKNAGLACVAVDDTVQALGALAAAQRRQRAIPVVAITGSNGKTSTRQMTSLVMARKYRTLATQGNFNNEIGLPLTLFGLEETHQAAVLELGMNHAGEIDRLGRIAQPTIGVITNVGPAHLEFLGSLDGVARAKGELLRHIDPAGCAVLNGDDPRVAAMAGSAPCRVLFFGTGPQADIRAEAITHDSDGITFDLVLPEERVSIRLQASGRFMVINALAAAATGAAAGVGATDIKNGLQQFTPERGRLNVVQTRKGVTIIDDTYNANPASMAAAFDTLKMLRGQNRGFIALGDMLELGAQSESLHRQVGQWAAGSGAQMVLAHGPTAEAVLDGAVAGGMDRTALFKGSKTEIANRLTQLLGPGDWLLVKGSRGMAMEAVVAAVAQWGDDLN